MTDVKKKDRSDSYQSRGSTDCIMLGDIEDQVCWGIVRFSKHDCYLCEGHRAPPDYIEEPVAATAEELAKKRKEIDARVKAEQEAKTKAIEDWGVAVTDEEWLEGGWTAATWEQYQANRWFRPLLEGIEDAGIGMFWNNLTDVMLAFLHSLIGEGLRCGPLHGEGLPEAVNDRLLGMGRQATAKMVQLGVPFPDGCYELKLAPEWGGGPINMSDHTHAYHQPFSDRLLAMLMHHLSNKEVQLLWGCAYIVCDFSGLERGTRQLVEHVYTVMGDEIENRELPRDALDELKW